MSRAFASATGESGIPMISRRPQSMQELRRNPGLGSMKAATYGLDVVCIFCDGS